MEFSFKPRITRDLILSRYTEEQIMEYYLGIPVRKGLFRSPLRKDRHVTCSFFRSRSGYLTYKDFATGQHFNVFGLVQELFRCSFHEALRIMANDLGIVPDDTMKRNKGIIRASTERITAKETCRIRVEVKDFTTRELGWWNRYGIGKDILDTYQVYSCRHVFCNGEMVAESRRDCPIYGYYGGKRNGMELWKVYFPMRRSSRFLNNWPGRMVQGYSQLPDEGKLVVVTKSMKDVMCLRSCGISACAPLSENQFLTADILQSLKDRFGRVAVLYDNDRAGMSNMASIRRKYPELLYAVIPKATGAKDISDHYAMHGRTKTLDLILDYILWLREKD